MAKALQHRGVISGFRLRIAAATLVIALASAAQAQTFTVLYTFTGMADQSEPDTALIMDSAGNLYGTTGKNSVFKLSPSGELTTIHTFQGFRHLENLNPLFMTAQGTFFG